MSHTIQTDRVAPQLNPQPGSPVVLLPVQGGEPTLGELTVYSATALVTTSRIRIEADRAQALSGRRVFARIRAQENLVVVQGMARPVAGHTDEIELVGITGLAVESRRASVRADLSYSITLHSVTPDEAATSAQTVDVSAGGCRIAIPPQVRLSPGQQLQLSLTTPSGLSLELRAEVVRLDASSGTAAVRFTDISAHDADHIDRDVLLWLSALQGA